MPRGDKWIVCASGPSMLAVDLQHLRRFSTWRVIVVNNTWSLLPWADVLYACDFRWWETYGEAASVFAGQKWTTSGAAAMKHGIKRIGKRDGAGLCIERGHIHTGGNSGYQAVNLAYHFGAKRIVLLGFDMHRKNGAHWHGEHRDMISAPESHINAWVRMFEPMARDMKMAGVDVVNATPGSALPWFRMASMGEALR